MFGNLFDSEPGSSTFSGSGSFSFPSNLQVPAPPRPPCGLCGLQNQGATCYLNTLLQTLLYTPEFREGLLGVPLWELQGSPCVERTPPGGLHLQEPSAGDTSSNQVKERVIPLQLQRLFARLLLLDAHAVSTNDLTLSFGWKEQEELYQQQDVQELHRILFAALERSLVGTSGSQLIGELHRGTLTNQVRCQQCKNVSQSLEDFLDLTLIVSKDICRLEQSLCCSYREHENLKGSNQYFCSHCQMPVDAEKSCKIKFLPPILTFSLLRFNYDFLNGRRYKETGDFSFPMELDMGPFCSQPQGSVGTSYELFSVIIHSGNTFGGHYHVYIKDVECLGVWDPLPSEVHVSPSEVRVPPSEVHAPQKLQKVTKTLDPLPSVTLPEPVPLVSAILAIQDGKGLAVETLCAEIASHCGTSWNRRFKKLYGPILKFLTKYDDLFVVDQKTNLVFLKIQKPQNPAPIAEKQSKETKIEIPTPEAHWFDFNDSQVRAIWESEIPKQFKGQESAYMLCYRSKSLVRPSQAIGNSVYAVPDHLLSLISDENARLIEERDEHERLNNRVAVRLLFGVDHHSHQGALQPIEKSVRTKTVDVDQRRNLQHLRDLILDECPDLSDSANFVLHRTLTLPAGIHLLQELNLDQKNCSLIDLKVSDQDQLFVSYGNQVLGVPVGSDSVPILLTLNCHLSAGTSQDLTWAFPQNSNVAELKSVLCSVLPALQLPLRICPSLTKGNSGWETGFPDEASLESLALSDGDQLLVSEVHADNRCLRVDIYDRTQQVSSKHYTKDVDFPSHSFSALRDMDLQTLKKEVLLRLVIPLERSTDLRFRKTVSSEETYLQPPLHENHRLGEVFPDGPFCPLVLEEGSPPADNEITLFWSIGISPTPHHQANFAVDCAVSQCLDRICFLSGVQGLGTTWHLSVSNWLGEPDKTGRLGGDDGQGTLEGLQHGDHLCLQEGPPSPPAFLALQVRLFPTPECVPPATLVSSSAAGLQSQCRQIEALFKEQWNLLSQPFLSLGQVELPGTCTLAELKKQILTLPPLSGLHVPSALHLRLRLWQKKSMARVLRGHNQPLSRLKLCNQQILCAELLEHEEDLMLNDVLLNVIRRFPGERHCSSPMQVVWSSGKKATSRSLLTSLTSSLHMNVRKAVVAKYRPQDDRWQLLAIGDSCNTQGLLETYQFRKGKVNLRQHPYLLAEGDTVAIKDMALESDKLDDFWTESDLERQEQVRARVQQSSLWPSEDEIKEELPSAAEKEPQRPLRPEVGISIHVDDFS